MSQVKITVLQADGKYRGGLFKDSTTYENRWTGAPKPGLQESMVCSGSIEAGGWFLIEYVFPREITGEEERDSLFDENSRCCNRTPTQALHWFMQQGFGSPPALVERVRRFAAEWEVFCASRSARALLQTLIERKFTDDDDPLFAGSARDDLELLHRLELAPICSGCPVSYFADSVAQDMGVEGYIAWMNAHLDRVSEVIRSKGVPPTSATPRNEIDQDVERASSKVRDQAPSDARDAFHRATMAVYADLGALIAILQKEPNLRDALLALDAIAEHRAPEPGDTELIASLKHVVGHLLESLNTLNDVREQHPRAGSAFWRGRGIDRTWGAIASGSYHNVALGAAEAMLEPDAAGAAQWGDKAPAGGASGVIRQKVIEAAMDADSWARLAENLEHEYRSASLLPKPSPDEPKSPDASLGQADPRDGAAHRVGPETLQHLRAVLNIGTQVRYPQATRGLQELRDELGAEDLGALERALAAKQALEDAETAAVANSEGRMPIDGPVFEALRDAGLASINGNHVVFFGGETERERIVNAGRAKLQAALEAAQAAFDAAPRPEQAIRNAHTTMLSILRERLGDLWETLREHGSLVARPLDQEAPRYGPTVGSHPPQFWTGPSGHDVLARMAAAVLDAIDGGEDAGIVIHDEEWERLRSDVQRESGELARRAPSAGAATGYPRGEPGQTGQPGRSAATVPPQEFGTDVAVPEAVVIPAWEDLSPKQHAVISWMLVQPRGEAFSRSQILDSAAGIHNKGNDRVVLDQLIELGLIKETAGKRPQLRLATRPAGIPSTLPRHASWSDP